VLKWSEKVSGSTLLAVGGMLTVAYGVLGFLATTNWQHAQFALQVVNLLTIAIGFAVLVWGFWGGVVSAAAACFIAFLVTVIAGRWSLTSGTPFARLPFFMESVLFFLTAYLSLQFLEREEVEEIADRRQLDRLEEEYLGLAKEFGKREELLKVLEKKRERFKRIDAMAAKLAAAREGKAAAIQLCLGELAQIVGKGEAEVVIYADKGVVRHPLSMPVIPVEAGRDEIDRWLDEHRTALLVNNLTHDVRFTHEFGRSRQIVSLVAVPLIWDNRLQGTLRLTSVVPQAFSHDDLRFASEAASLLLPILSKS
jgi:hypothetical protein